MKSLNINANAGLYDVQAAAAQKPAAGYFNPADERPINANATGQYDMSAMEDFTYDEFEDNYSEVEMATIDGGMIDQVKQVYADILNQSISPFIKQTSF